MASRFHFLDNIAVADCAFIAEGDNPSELFQAATQAVIETMADPQTISWTWTHVVEKQEPTVADLLFEWLNELVYLKDAEGVLFHDANISVSFDPTNQTWLAMGQLRGETIDLERQDLRADVKAVTKHMYEVRQEDKIWTARVVLDL